MAKRRKSTSMVRTVTIPSSQYRAPAPIIKVSAPRAIVPKSKRRKGGGHSRKKSTGLSFGTTLMGASATAGAIGLAEKAGLLDKLPDVPFVGRKGALAIAAYIWARYGGGGAIARDVALCASVLSAYQLGKEGTISGESYLLALRG